MKKKPTQEIVALLTAASVLVPSVAFARKSPLEGEPDVRHKYELRLKRFEIAPTFEATVQADYQHTISGGLKLEYHITDSLSIGGLIFLGTSFDTALTESISASLVNPNDPVAPSREGFENGLNTMPMHGGVGATFTPWFGKLNLFSKLYLAFDIYVSGGFGFAQLDNAGGKTGCEPVKEGDDLNMNPVFTDPRNDDPCNAGFRPGIQVGAGMHVFVNKWMALDLSFRDYFFTDNPSGGDFNADRKVDDEDPRFLGHLFFGFGLSFYLPAKVKISR